MQTVPFSLKTAGGEYAPDLAAVKPNDTALPPCAASVALYASGVAITFRPDWTTFAFQYPVTVTPLSGKAYDSVQPSMGVSPVLVTVTCALKPLPQPSVSR